MCIRRSRRFRHVCAAVLVWMAVVLPASAATIRGVAADLTGAVLPSARITARHVTTGVETRVQAGADGHFEFPSLPDGEYLVLADAEGFAVDTRVVTVPGAAAIRFALTPGGVDLGVTVTATRSERQADDVPVRADVVTRDTLQTRMPLSTGDALLQTPGIAAVSSGPMQVRPRLRGLDSTRVLILVDGERLNHARTATDRAGTEVGLIDVQAIERLEVVSGSGSVLYGTDALSGTINIQTQQPSLSDRPRLTVGFDGYASSNEQGRRGTVTLGASGRRFAVQFLGTRETYDDYRAGRAGRHEDTTRFVTDGTVAHEDTIDDNFGFAFGAFPDPFNAPYTRTSATIPMSGASGQGVTITGLVAPTERQTLQVKYIGRRMEDVGFPDFESPVFFTRMTLPRSRFDRVSARYEARQITSWFTNVRATAYWQDSTRLSRSELPVQFPVPSPRFFPISVYRLHVTTDTEQHVQTPGLDLQATFVPARHHIVTAGMMAYVDRSRDSRTNTSQTTVIGDVSLGTFGPVATVYPTPLALGPASVTHPVRVPDAAFRNLGVFVQDEWTLHSRLRLVAGLRLDHYRVASDATDGYDVASLVAGAAPAIDPVTLPDTGGDRLTRRAVTGDLGLVLRLSDGLRVQARYGRSYRHANLEELLFSGPATIGAIVPNMAVQPETGHNVDLGLRFRAGRVSGTVSYFINQYDGMISTEIVSVGTEGPLSQAINFTDVRIQGLEATLDAPIVTRVGVLTVSGQAAYTRGTVLDGTNRLTGESLAGTPQDNISPLKVHLGARFTEPRDRWWLEYGARLHATVERVAPTLLNSPYLIPQDLLALEGFVVQRVACGVNLRPSGGRLGLVVAVENLTDRFYREPFQFAPARGRSITLGLHVRGL